MSAFKALLNGYVALIGFSTRQRDEISDDKRNDAMLQQK